MKYILSIFIFFISTFAFAEIDKETLNNIYSQLREIDYSYESHIDIPYDLNGENKHVNRRLSQSEQDKYYKDPLVYMTKQAQTDWQRALEMSMYYQGWKPNTIFYRFDLLQFYNEFNSSPTTDDMRFKTREILDKKKSLFWAKKAFDLSQKELLTGNNSNQLTAQIAIENLLFRYDESNLENKNRKIEEILNYLKNKEIDSLIAEIVYSYKNFGSIRFDNMNVFKFKFTFELKEHYWRNYYCGFVYPQNKDFSLTLIQVKTIFNRSEIQSFFKITSGLYDRNDYNKNISIYWGSYFKMNQELYITSTLKFWAEEQYNFGDFLFPLLKYSIKEYKPSSLFNRNELSFKNPHYDKDKAFIELKRVLKNYKPDRGTDPIIQFVLNAPSFGIEESLYNEILEEIYKECSLDFLKEKEKSAREWFNGRIGDAYDYR